MRCDDQAVFSVPASSSDSPATAASRLRAHRRKGRPQFSGTDPLTLPAASPITMGLRQDFSFPPRFLRPKSKIPKINSAKKISSRSWQKLAAKWLQALTLYPKERTFDCSAISVDMGHLQTLRRERVTTSPSGETSSSETASLYR